MSVAVDFVRNGRAETALGEDMIRVWKNPGLYRPFIDDDGVKKVTVNTRELRFNPKTKLMEPVRKTVPVRALRERYDLHLPVWNATALRKLEWIQLDRAVVTAFREPLRAWSDLAAASSAGGFDAFGHTTYEYEAMSDPGEAVVDMDALTDGRDTQPLFDLRSLPLPITHMDFGFSSRREAVSRNGGSPISTTMGEAAARRVAEKVEDTTIGLETGIAYGYQSTGVTAHNSTIGSQVYGYTNFPYRNTKTNMTVPTGSNPDATVNDVLAMIESLQQNDKCYGPYMLYHSFDWSKYLDDDYFTGTYAQGLTNVSTTLRERLRRIEGIQDVRRLDRLTSTFTMILVQMGGSEVAAKAINGMGVTTVQWDEKGGLKRCFKVMAIQVPLMLADYSGNCGIMHGTTA